MDGGLPDDPTVGDLKSLNLADLVVAADEEGSDAVQEFLVGGIEVSGEFLADHGKTVRKYPRVIYDQFESGVAYDPLYDGGEAMVVGGPRGLLRGGEQVLADRTGFTQRSILTILCKGLLLSYDVQLTEDREGGRARTETKTIPGTGRRVRLYDALGFPSPEIDQAFTTFVDVYLEGDITDRALREAVVEEWTEWFEEGGGVGPETYSIVAFAVSDRITDAEGTPKELFCHGLEIQEPLIRDADVSVLTRR